jgi:type I restriction enzyme M protein
MPHPKDQSVFWARIERDGHLKVKSKRLPAPELRPPRKELDQIPLIIDSLRSFVAAPGSATVNIPKLCKTAPIDFNDPLLELLPEAYLDTEMPSSADLSDAVDSMVRETAAFLVRFGKETKVGAFDETD